MAPSSSNVCVGCGAQQGPKRDGAFYELRSDKGEELKAWLCDSCAIDLGPPQGPIVITPGMKAKA